MDIILHYPTVPQQPITTSLRTSNPPSTPQVGQLYIVTCSVSKLPGLTHTPTAQWIKVTMGIERISMPTANQAALEFSSLRTSDSGRYRCQGNLTTTVQRKVLSDSSDFDLIAQSESDIHNKIIELLGVLQYQDQQ